MDVLVACIGLGLIILFGVLSVFARPYQPRPRFVRLKPQFGLRSLFLITCLSAGLCGCLQTVHVVTDAVALTACWTICGAIGALEGASWRGIGVWRGAAFAGAVGGASGGVIFAAAILVLGRSSFALVGDMRHAWPHIACLLIWGLCIGTLIGCSVGALKFIDRRALRQWSRKPARTPVAVTEPCDARLRRMSPVEKWNSSLIVASVASVLIHFAAVHSPPLPLPGALSKGQAIESDVELVLAAVAVQPPHQPTIQPAVQPAPQPAPQPEIQPEIQRATLLTSHRETIASDNFRLSEVVRPAAQVTPSSRQDLLRVASKRTGTDAAVCLDGYCPVTLSQQAVWTKGDDQIATVYQGRTYRFANEQAQREFMNRPDTYAAAMSGYDPVLLLDENRLEEGEREHGVFYQNRVYLFSSEVTLQQFARQAGFYVSATRGLENALAQAARYFVAKPVVDSMSPAGDENSQAMSHVRIDLIELNHFKDELGRLVFSQLIFWSTYPDGQLHIRDWRLQKTPATLPRRRGNVWICEGIPSGKGSQRVLTLEAPAYRETTTTIDPELEDRKNVEKSDRIPLWTR